MKIYLIEMRDPNPVSIPLFIQNAIFNRANYVCMYILYHSKL